jgi:hypothetical protein
MGLSWWARLYLGGFTGGVRALVLRVFSLGFFDLAAWSAMMNGLCFFRPMC